MIWAVQFAVFYDAVVCCAQHQQNKYRCYLHREPLEIKMSDHGHA